MKTRSFLTLTLLLATLALPLLANKSAVSIDAPATVKAGEEATIIIKVSHRGNSSLHFTKRLVVMANGKEIARWNFSSGNRPDRIISPGKSSIKSRPKPKSWPRPTATSTAALGRFRLK